MFTRIVLVVLLSLLAQTVAAQEEPVQGCTNTLYEIEMLRREIASLENTLRFPQNYHLLEATYKHPKNRDFRRKEVLQNRNIHGTFVIPGYNKLWVVADREWAESKVNLSREELAARDAKLRSRIKRYGIVGLKKNELKKCKDWYADNCTGGQRTVPPTAIPPGRGLLNVQPPGPDNN